MNTTTIQAAALPVCAPVSIMRWRDGIDSPGTAPVAVMPFPVLIDGTGVTPSAHPLHNSIQPMGAVPAEAGRRAYAAKQAAPPRGRYR